MSSAATVRPGVKCSDCNDTGWRRVGNAVERCQHVEAARKERGISASLRHTIPISAHELRAHVAVWLKAGRGPTNVPFEPRQRQLLGLLAHHLGQAKAAPLHFFARSLEAGQGAEGPLLPGARGGVSDRELKQLVRDLRVVHRIKVGSLRGWRRVGGKSAAEGPRGYFLCLTANDVLATFGPRLHEALATREVCDAMTDGRSGLNKLVAQARGFIQQEFSFSEERKTA